MAVYGATSLPFPIFLAGMFLGSLKPYLLDSCEWFRRVSGFILSMLVTGRRGGIFGARNGVGARRYVGNVTLLSVCMSRFNFAFGVSERGCCFVHGVL